VQGVRRIHPAGTPVARRAPWWRALSTVFVVAARWRQAYFGDLVDDGWPNQRVSACCPMARACSAVFFQTPEADADRQAGMALDPVKTAILTFRRSAMAER